MDVGDHRNAHRRRTIARGLAAAALGAAWAVAATLLLDTEVPPLALDPPGPEAVLPAGDLVRAERYRDVLRWLWVAAVLAQVGTLVFLAHHGRRIASWAARGVHGRVRTGVATALAVTVAVWAVGLVPGAIAHWWSRRYGLAVQGYGGWLADRAIGLALLALLVALVVAGLLLLAARFGRSWWLPGAAALAACGLVVVLLQPLVLDSLLTGTRPVTDPRLSASLVELGARLGVDVTGVEVARASERTTAPNARVTGLGPTRRIAIDDTLLDGRFTDAEIRAVAAHELAHVARHHVWKGVAWFALLVLPGAAILAWLVGRRGDPGGPDGPALVPFALLVAVALYFAALPVANAVSRRYEREADWLALVATDDPAAAASLVRGIAGEALVDPDPPRWSRVLLGTHPPSVERLAMALEQGRRQDVGSAGAGTTIVP